METAFSASPFRLLSNDALFRTSTDLATGNWAPLGRASGSSEVLHMNLSTRSFGVAYTPSVSLYLKPCVQSLLERKKYLRGAGFTVGPYYASVGLLTTRALFPTRKLIQVSILRM